MVQEAVEHGADGGGVSQQLAPILDGTIGGDQGTGPLVAAEDNFQEFFGRGEGQLAHPKIIDDEQGHGGYGFQVVFPAAIEGGIGKLIKQDVSFAVEDSIALLDGGLAEGLGVALYDNMKLRDCVFSISCHVQVQEPFALKTEISVF